MDYGGWVDRAITFTYNVETLDGGEQSLYEAASPLTPFEMDEIRSRWKRHLPGELVKFWTQGSAHLTCSYYWVPPNEKESTALSQSLDRKEIFGGPDFLPPEEVDPEPHDLSDFFYADGQPKLPWSEDEVRRCMLWERAVIFIRLSDSSCIGLLPETPDCDPNNPPVAYLSFCGRQYSHLLAPSFTDFLEQWEKLSYIGRELFGPWLDEKTEMLVSDNPRTAVIRPLLTPRS